MTIKKNFEKIVSLLEKNKDKRVDSVLPKILELCTSKKKAGTVQKDEKGNITHIFCYYHKEWEPIEWYGKKASSHTGFNTMCKVGVNQWTKQQSEARKAKDEILLKVQEGTLNPNKIQEEKERIEQQRLRIEPRPTEKETEEK